MRSIASVKNDIEAVDKSLAQLNDVITNFNNYAAQGMVSKSLNDYFIDESILIDQKNALTNEYNNVLNYIKANGNNNNANNFNRGIGRPMNSHDPYNRVGVGGNPPAMTRGGIASNGNPYLNGTGSTGTTGIGTLGSNPNQNPIERNVQQPIQTQQPITPIIPKKEPVLPNYFKEKAITVSLKDGKPFLSGVPSSIEPIELDCKKWGTISPLWDVKEAAYGVRPGKKMRIPYDEQFDWLLDKPFSQLDFKEVDNGLLCIENILYYHIKDILENFAELGYGNKVNTTEIADIQNFMKDPDVPVSGTLLVRNVFDKIILTRENGGEGKDFIVFDLNTIHVYYKSRAIDYDNIIKSFTTLQGNKFILTEESYGDLYHLLKSLKVHHGTLELYGGIQFKYYIGKEVINLVRL